MNNQAAIQLLTMLHSTECHLVFPVCDDYAKEDAEKFLRQIKQLGYVAYLRTTELGNEVVVNGTLNKKDSHVNNE